MKRSLHPLGFLGLGGLLLSASWALAEPAPPADVPKPVGVLAGRPDTDPSAEPLGPRYENRAAGISFQPPAGTRQALSPNDGEVVEFVNEPKNWLLRVSKPTFPTPVPLKTIPNRNGKPETTGLLDYTVQELKRANPGAKLLRGDHDDIINVDSNYVGMIALRFSLGTQRWLRQQAILQVNDQLYYILNLTTPAGKINPGDDEDKLPPDPSEKAAVDAFAAVVDSIKIIDRAPIKEDQNQRLFRTRSLFLYWTSQKFDAIKLDRQFYRILHDGKDVGYSYVLEMQNDSKVPPVLGEMDVNPKLKFDPKKLSGVDDPGAIVYERTHTVDKDEKGQSRYVDVGSFKFMSFDRKRESWTRTLVTQVQTPAGPDETHSTEYAESKWETKLVPAPESGVLQKEDNALHHPPLMRPVDSHTLDVNVTAKGSTAQPLHLDLPPFYLPQAGQYLLPRLVVDKVFRGERTYLFASYIPETRDIRMRYVDVSDEQDVTFNGQRLRAMVVSERIGLEGSPTRHYVTSAGVYLGSEKKSTRLVMIPSDEASILKLWPDAKLTRPDQMKHPAPPPEGT